MALDWQSWFEPERFLDTLTVPVSVCVAFIILRIERNKKVQLLISKLFSAENPIISFKEVSGLKIFTIWNLLLGVGLIIFGFLYHKKIDVDGLMFVSWISFFGASLGWSYAFKYFEEAWKTKAVIFGKLSSLFLVLAISEKIINIYKGKTEWAPLFYFTIPPLILLLQSKMEKDRVEKSRVFWLSSLTFNLVLVGIFFMDGVGKVKTKSVSSIVFWLYSFLTIAPTVATYISLINLQKQYRLSSESYSKINLIFRIIAFSFFIGLTLIASFGIKTVLSAVQNKKAEYKAENDRMIKDF